MNIALATRRLLPPLVAACARNRLRVVLIALLLAAASLWVTYNRLGVTTDTSGMFANSLPWKQRSDAIAREFPQNDDLIVAVVDARIPEEADATAAALADALAHDPHFKSIRRPDASPYLRRNALLLIDQPALQEVLDRTIDAQPFLGELAADPSLRGLFSALGLVVQGAIHGQTSPAMEPALRQFHTVMSEVLAGRPEYLSWQQLLAGKLSEQAGRYRFVLFKPVLDYGALEPGGTATDLIRKTVRNLEFVRDHEARVRLTGSVVLDDEEFATVAQGAVLGLIGSFVLVMLWLYLAVRSWRLMVPILTTLVLGLLLTTGFAAVAIGTLNLISVAFAVLFVGIAVDFAIQFAVRLRERRFTYPDMTDALRETGRRSGAQILVAALATAAGFLAFTPTKFVGVAQLGIIAGFGMIIAFSCTLTFLPAMLCICGPRREPREVGFAFAKPFDPAIHRFRWAIAGVFLVMGSLGGILAHKIPFDGDPLHTKNKHSEAMRALHDLMQEPITNPYTIESVEPNQSAARAAGERLAKLQLTQDVLSLDSFVPQDQPAKLAMLADAESVLGPTLIAAHRQAAMDIAALRHAASALASDIEAARSKLTPGSALIDIGSDAGRLAVAPDSTLLLANTMLTRFLPQQLETLREALSAKAVKYADVPAELRNDWILPDGRARVQALPKSAVADGRGLRRWVKSALRVVPEASGSAVWILKSADTITNAFQIAAYSALGAIAIILSLALRRALDVVLVMTPLLMSGLLTALIMFVTGMSLNFANIIALPLLLGVGVSFNIYFVMNWRSGVARFLGSATARAIIFSALTTSTAFGSLALSQHPGTASMGVLLLLSLGCTVVTTLLLLPALLALAPHPRVPLGGG